MGEEAQGLEPLKIRAREVLDGNWTGRSTLPNAGLYPHQWNWDTGFIAIGRSRYDQARAEVEMSSLFEGQWSTGMLPHIKFNPEVPAESYFPGPEFWRSDLAPGSPRNVSTSGITQPPVHAIATLEMHRRAQDPERSHGFLEHLFPKLVALHEYFRDRRSASDDGLTYIVHPWESGLDNSPAWDEALTRVQIPEGALPEYQRRDLTHADPRDRPSDEAYDRFVYLAVSYREVGYDDVACRDRTPFLVEDPMFNAIWAWSAHALAEIAGILGEDGARFEEDGARITKAIEEKLWLGDGIDRFYPLDVRSGEPTNHHSVVSFMPLIAPGLDSDLVRRTLASMEGLRHCGRDYLLPSYDTHDSDYNPRQYWRGPIWINTDWLLYRGCSAAGAVDKAEELRTAILDLVRLNGFREYFEPHGEAGYGADSFSWTAALFLDVASEA
ncbi:MAG: MGH1-like glycoside hydrolase domain-containing protein [Actinomycetota bacterium]